MKNYQNLGLATLGLAVISYMLKLVMFTDDFVLYLISQILFTLSLLFFSLWLIQKYKNRGIDVQAKPKSPNKYKPFFLATSVFSLFGAILIDLAFLFNQEDNFGLSLVYAILLIPVFLPSFVLSPIAIGLGIFNFFSVNNKKDKILTLAVLLLLLITVIPMYLLSLNNSE